MADLLLSITLDRLAQLLIEEFVVLRDAVRHVKWIEKELRSMQGLLQQVDQRGDGEQEQALKDWADELNKVAGDAEDVIETFVIKSVKRRRWGVMFFIDKHKIGKELVDIRKRMKDISQTGINLNTGVTVSVSDPGGEASSSSSTSVVAPSLEKLEHILSQPIVTSDKVMEMVELVKGELVRLQNIVSNLRSASETENVWLEEVEEICNYTKSAAGNFILAKERRSKKGRLQKVLHLLPDHASEYLFQENMKYVRTQIGDAVRRSFTYGVGDVLSSYLPLQNIVSNLRSASETENVWLEEVEEICNYTKSAAGNFILAKERRSKKGMLQKVLVNLRRSVDKNFEYLQKDLYLMEAFLRDIAAKTEQAGLNLNERQKVWVSQFRHVAQNTQSFFYAYSKVRCFLGLIFRRTGFAQDSNCLLKEILSISERKNIYDIANIIQGTPELAVATTTSLIIQEEREIQREHEPPPAQAVASSSYRPQTGLKEKVQSMRAEIELIDALSRDVEEMGGELDKRSRIWVDQMKSIATEARCVINDYVSKLEHKKLIVRVLFKVQGWRLINNKINQIRSKIEDVSRRKKAYGLVEIQFSAGSSSSTVQISRGRVQPSLVVAAAKESSIVGFDDDKQVLMAQLLSGEKRRCITWIVGIRGTGKTTLANLIFQDNSVVDHFDCCLWVSLSPNSNSNYTPQQLLEKIAKDAAKNIKAEDSSSEPVLETLVRTKYLMVLDGIEETSQVYLLDTLKEAIPDFLTGSRLLLTTRNAKIARHVAGGTITFVHPLQLLDDETSWVVFTRNLKVDILQEELVKFGRKYVMKCGGLPLQIIKMSDLLTVKYVGHKDEVWSSMLNQIQDQIQSWSETLKTINTDLPLYLRRCLSYFGLFPAGFGIPVRRLVVLWVAESLVHHSEEDEVPLELVAERYLTELIDRNMVQVATRKHNGKVKTCHLPDPLRQIWLTDSRSLYGHRPATDLNADPKNPIIRRVVDHLNSGHIWHNDIHGDTSPSSSSLRTNYKDVISFMSFDPHEGSKPGEQIGNFLKECISSDCFLLLRVLDLERVYKPKLPKRIARLTQLRYLGLRWTYLESLPSSISSLLKLQTLDLKHTYIHTLPSSIWKMELRHLFLSETYRTRFPPQPKGNFLSDLQTLWGLFVDEETPVKGGFDKLVNIKKLGLACQSMSLDPTTMKTQLEAVADWIAKLEHLQSLRLKSRNEPGHPSYLLLKSFVNHTNLTDIYLLGSLSSNVLSQFPLSLIELTLSHSKLKDDPMKLLKDFPNIQTLCLLAESYVGTTMVCETQSFPQLRVLKFWVLEQLEEWKIEQGALPCLRQLEIRSCPNLKMLPDGLEYVNTLLELKLTNMSTEIDADMHNILPNCQVVQHNLT